MLDAALLPRLTSREELGRVLDRQAERARYPAWLRPVALADARAESWLETWGRLTFAASEAAMLHASGGAMG